MFGFEGFIFEGERASKQAGRGRERERHTHTESKAGTRLQAVSTEPSAGLKL